MKNHKMTSNQIKEIIHQEIGDRWDISNAHGVVLKDCIIEPIKKRYFSFDESESYELWTVLEELPDGTGYKIIYNESTQMFSLAMLSNKNTHIDLGSYGDFMTTLEAM